MFNATEMFAKTTFAYLMRQETKPHVRVSRYFRELEESNEPFFVLYQSIQYKGNFEKKNNRFWLKQRKKSISVY